MAASELAFVSLNLGTHRASQELVLEHTHPVIDFVQSPSVHLCDSR